MSPLKLAFGWSIVGIPLIYGIIQTLSKVAALFG